MTSSDQTKHSTTQGLGLGTRLAVVGLSGDLPVSLRCELPVGYEAAGTARAQLNRHFADRLTPAEQDSAKLILTELVANAVEASSSSGLIWLEAQLAAGELLLEVFDQSGEVPHRRPADDLAEGGRGLLLVEELSTHWGWRPEPGGKVVWAVARASAA
ncbi:ATP-binding protein [Kitasatospora sp. LaBMicrA B282]|uniref:ATP-binding protein n=1 Tax=Kitasatospora sp. LaBMicrA B282 TaxID=3420949 RepID=UPI003D0EDE99